MSLLKSEGKLMVHTSYYNSPIGQILLAAKNEALVGLWIENQKYFFSSIKDEEIKQENCPVLEQVKKWLNLYFTGEKPEISELKLAPVGSEFRQLVWEFLCNIPYGEVVSYGKIAKIIAEKYGRKHMSPQAIGGAVGHNAISIIIPCHRVVGSNGNLTGYAGGIDKKIWLLKHEGVDIKKFFVPNKSISFQTLEK